MLVKKVLYCIIVGAFFFNGPGPGLALAPAQPFYFKARPGPGPAVLFRGPGRPGRPKVGPAIVFGSGPLSQRSAIAKVQGGLDWIQTITASNYN